MGIGADTNWLVIENPRLADILCWVSRSDVDEPQDFDPDGVQVFAIPPLPTATPEQEKADRLPESDRLPTIPTDTICVPRACTPNDNPAAAVRRDWAQSRFLN